MDFSALETLALTLIGSGTASAATKVWMSRSFVTQQACKARAAACADRCELKHSAVHAEVQATEEHVAELRQLANDRQSKTSETLDQLFCMVRALILYSDIPSEKKEAILNGRWKQ